MARDKDNEEELQEVSVEGKGTTHSTTPIAESEAETTAGSDGGTAGTSAPESTYDSAYNRWQQQGDEDTPAAPASAETTAGSGGGEAGAGTDGEAGNGEAGGGGGYNVPMPQRSSRYSDMVGPYSQPYSDKELEKAKKKGKRESRMATAGHIMDTLARVLNYAATTQGAPSAKWSNQNREVDPNTYYSKLRGENDQARKDYMNMVLAAGKADNDEYSTDISAWREGNKDQREADLQPYKIRELIGNADKAEAEAKVKEIEAQYKPGQEEAKQKVFEAQAKKYEQQGRQAAAAAVASYAAAAKHRAEAKKGEYHFNGQTYHNKEDWQKAIDSAWEKIKDDNPEFYKKMYEDDTTEKTDVKYDDINSIDSSTVTTTTKKKKRDYSTLAAMYETEFKEGSLAGGGN